MAGRMGPPIVRRAPARPLVVLCRRSAPRPGLAPCEDGRLQTQGEELSPGLGHAEGPRMAEVTRWTATAVSRSARPRASGADPMIKDQSTRSSIVRLLL